MTSRHYAQVSKLWNERSGLNEIITASIATLSDKTILAFSNKGNAYKLDPSSLPDCKFRDKGVQLNKIAPSALPDEKIVYFMELKDNLLDENLLFFTRQGMIKKTAVSEYQLLKSAYQAVKLKDDDEVISIEKDRENTTILFVTKEGMGLNAMKNDIPVQGRVSGGVKGISLSDTDNVVLVSQITQDDSVIIVSDKAYAKRVNVNEIDVLARYRKGVKIFDLKGLASSGTKILSAGLFKENSEVIVKNSSGDYSCINASSVVEDTRSSRGKSLSIGDAIIDEAYIRTL